MIVQPQGHVIAEPADLKSEFPLARQTGYLFADAPSSYTPPAELVKFLAAKTTKPLYIGAWETKSGILWTDHLTDHENIDMLWSG